MESKLLSEEQIEQAVERYRQGLSLATAGKVVGVDKEAVRLRLIEQGIRIQDSHGRQ